MAIALPVGPVITELIRRGLAGGFLQGWLVGLGFFGFALRLAWKFLQTLR